MKVVLASNNRGKLAELDRLFAHLAVELVPQSVLEVVEADETGTTFVENALLKARSCCNQTQMPAIADDSGLVVPALAGEPGIRSARYAGTQGNDNANNTKLLHALSTCQSSSRAAYFYCALVYLRHERDPAPLIATGEWHGSIVVEPRGTTGFGYDPLFQANGRTETAAELAPNAKNAISHRGQAAARLVELLTTELAGVPARTPA